jgi:hypothetical protein
MGDLKSGGPAPSEFPGSMAQAIEQSLNALLIFDGKDPLPTTETDETRDRRRLFIAISQGVIDHLQANADAFEITHRDGDSVIHDVEIR